MNVKQSFTGQPTIASFTTLIDRNFTFFSFKNQISSRKPTDIKPNTVQTLQFFKKNAESVLLRTENHQPLFAEMPRTHFLSKQTSLFLYGIFIEDSESLSSVIFKNSPTHRSTLPNAKMGFIKVFITSVDPSHYNINDLKSLVHSVLHNNHPQIIEFRTVNYQDIKI